MIYGLDTGILVAAELVEHQDHTSAVSRVSAMIAAGDTFGLAPQVITEFLHVVTDGRRFQNPVPMSEAIALAEKWWTAQEVVKSFPNDDVMQQALAWLRQYSLGRKSLLDTVLAATYWNAGISSILTTNPADFATFGCFQCVTL